MKSKTCLYLLLSLFFLGCVSAKQNFKNYFHGQVNYVYTYTSDQLDQDSLVSNKATKSEFRYDAENYQSRFIGKDTFTYFYSGVRNKSLFMQNSRLDSKCEDYGQNGDTVITWRVYDTSAKVLGYACRVLEMQNRYFLTRYYVSKDLIIAPLTYQRHHAYNWSFYGEKAGGGLILKLEHHFPRYSMQGIATQIKRIKDGALQIDKAVFDKLCAGK